MIVVITLLDGTTFELRSVQKIVILGQHEVIFQTFDNLGNITRNVSSFISTYDYMEK